MHLPADGLDRRRSSLLAARLPRWHQRHGCAAVTISLQSAYRIAFPWWTAPPKYDQLTLHLQADTSEYTSNPIQIDGTEIDDEFFAAFDTAENLQDFYSVYLWNHCSGDSVDGRDDVKQCSGRTAGYAFDPIEVWGIDRAAIDEHFPEQLDRGLRIYRQVVRWMFAAYAIAFCATAAEIAVGIFAVCSRWGSFATTIVATVSRPSDFLPFQLYTQNTKD